MVEDDHYLYIPMYFAFKEKYSVKKSVNVKQATVVVLRSFIMP